MTETDGEGEFPMFKHQIFRPRNANESFNQCFHDFHATQCGADWWVQPPQIFACWLPCGVTSIDNIISNKHVRVSTRIVTIYWTRTLTFHIDYNESMPWIVPTRVFSIGHTAMCNCQLISLEWPSSSIEWVGENFACGPAAANVGVQISFVKHNGHTDNHASINPSHSMWQQLDCPHPPQHGRLRSHDILRKKIRQNTAKRKLLPGLLATPRHLPVHGHVPQQSSRSEQP